MRRRALLLALFFSGSLLLTPSLPAKDKTKTPTSDKIRQDFSKFGNPRCGKGGGGTVRSVSRRSRQGLPPKRALDAGSCLRTVPWGGQSACGSGRVLDGIERQDHQLPRPFRRASERRMPKLPLEIRTCPQLVFRRTPGAGLEVQRLPHDSWRGPRRDAWRVPGRDAGHSESDRFTPAVE